MRYFATIAYNGTRFWGWQTQASGNSVQQCIEQALATVLRTPTAVTGCGRTDTGVHAAHYTLHFDYAGALPDSMLLRLNHLVGRDIVFYKVWQVLPTAHARFDAVSRSYYYVIHTDPSPFSQETAWYYPHARHIDREAMQAVATLLLQYDDFATFCKTHTQVHTTRCTLTRCEWLFDDTAHRWVFHISANRFLRGMIRLIVGACLQVGSGKTTLAEVETALQQKQPLPKPLSVPPQGLFLHDIQY